MKDNQDPSTRVDFDRVIAPISRAEFFETYFEKKHLVIRRDNPDYYANLLRVADIDRVLTEQMVPGEELQLVRTGKGIPGEEYVTPSGLIDPVRVARFFDEGATIVLPGLQRRLAALAAYCRSMETVFNVDLQTNIYFTPEGSQGFKTHYDSHDVFVLQVAGSKTWNIYDSSALELPLRTQAFQPEGFQAGALIDTFTLHAGDMCYVPRGVVHDARATEELSLHITTGLLTPRWIELIVDAVNQLALADPAFRRAIPPGHANDGFDRTEARQVFRDLLARAVEGIDPDRTLDYYAHDYRSRRVPVVPGQLFQTFDAGAVAPGTELVRRPDLIYAIGVVGEEVVLGVYGTEIAFPAHVEVSLRDALSRSTVIVGELEGDLDEAGQAVMLRRLVREGVFALV
jgi:Cupin superfamily protein.